MQVLFFFLCEAAFYRLFLLPVCLLKHRFTMCLLPFQHKSRYVYNCGDYKWEKMLLIPNKETNARLNIKSEI